MKKVNLKIVIIGLDTNCQAQLTAQLLAYNSSLDISFFKPKSITLKSITEINPDLIFYDVESLKIQNDIFLQKIINRKYKVVLTSCKSEDAVEAFNYDSIGFLLWPYSFSAVLKICNRTIKNIEQRNNSNSRAKKSKQREYIAVNHRNDIDIIQKDTILYCKADGKYTEFHLTNGKTVISSTNIGKYETELTNGNFARVHHSYFVNLNFINRVEKENAVYCELSDGSRIPVAKRREPSFFRVVKEQY